VNIQTKEEKNSEKDRFFLFEKRSETGEFSIDGGVT